MRICQGIRADGGRCQAQCMKDSNYCLNHHPARAEANKARAAKGGRRGGRGRSRIELSQIRTQLQDLKNSVLDGSLDRGDASVAGNLLNYMVSCIRIELQAREQEELAERLAALEDALEEQKARTSRHPA
jgi:hypothetical protein